MQPNLERMLALVDEVFATRNDTTQLQVNEEVIARLGRMHPSTLAERADTEGPYAWILLIPTTIDLMNRFLKCEITEQHLYELTPDHGPYEALYMCSALVLPEYRRKGLALQVTAQAIGSIMKDHPIKALFTWAFSKAGEKATEKIALIAHLPLYKLVRQD